MEGARRAVAVDRRQAILDAAVKVFAERGFHACRVSDIADRAGVAYGLLYHYFDSKDAVLHTLFSERWALLLDAIAAIEADESLGPRERLAAVASFIVDSYRHDPDLMKVIVMEVTRAANTFGRAHLAEIERAYRGIAAIVERGQREGAFRDTVAAEFASLCFYGALEQLMSAWVFGMAPRRDSDFAQAKEWVVETICRGIEPV